VRLWLLLELVRLVRRSLEPKCLNAVRVLWVLETTTLKDLRKCREGLLLELESRRRLLLLLLVLVVVMVVVVVMLLLLLLLLLLVVVVVLLMLLILLLLVLLLLLLLVLLLLLLLVLMVVAHRPQTIHKGSGQDTGNQGPEILIMSVMLV
jgi:energy-coupling factor transporter transmembrane protein EcfT